MLYDREGEPITAARVYRFMRHDPKCRMASNWSFLRRDSCTCGFFSVWTALQSKLEHVLEDTTALWDPWERERRVRASEQLLAQLREAAEHHWHKYALYDNERAMYRSRAYDWTEHLGAAHLFDRASDAYEARIDIDESLLVLPVLLEDGYDSSARALIRTDRSDCWSCRLRELVTPETQESADGK